MKLSSQSPRTITRIFISVAVLCLLTRTLNASATWSCPRGGGDKQTAIADACSALTRFLANRRTSCASGSDNTHNDPKSDRFYIQGWRWHTMSLIREAGEIQRLAESMSQQSFVPKSTESATTLSPGNALHLASDYVVNFNMKGLHRIERDLFFPWARKKVADIFVENDVDRAFNMVMNQLEQDQKALVSMGESLLLETSRIAKSAANSLSKSELAKVAFTSAAIASCAQSMLHMEDVYLVPTIAALVPAKEQKAFNDKVIRKLGLLDSRLYLVGMHQALQAKKDPIELQLFEEYIPMLARKMIPWWKRSLYDPRVGNALNMVGGSHEDVTENGRKVQ